jgi:poly [ADP-ribose] polymerase 10/14/15
MAGQSSSTKNPQGKAQATSGQGGSGGSMAGQSPSTKKPQGTPQATSGQGGSGGSMVGQSSSTKNPQGKTQAISGQGGSGAAMAGQSSSTKNPQGKAQATSGQGGSRASMAGPSFTTQKTQASPAKDGSVTTGKDLSASLFVIDLTDDDAKFHPKWAQMGIPRTWVYSQQDGDPFKPTLKTVEPGSHDFDNCLNFFRQSVRIPKLVIKSIQRNQNPTLFNMCDTYRKMVLRREGRNPDMFDDALERYLFHGTHCDTAKKIAASGFNRSFAGSANAAAYGVGTYFARNASYSDRDSYTPKDKDGYKTMILCKVTVGTFALGVWDMRAPPARDDGRLHDSTVDYVSNPDIFVAYNDAQAYPEFIITYKRDDST